MVRPSETVVLPCRYDAITVPARTNSQCRLWRHTSSARYAALVADTATHLLQSCSSCFRLRTGEASFSTTRWLIHSSSKDQTWQAQFPSCCAGNMELSIATSPFTNHQPRSVPGCTCSSAPTQWLYLRELSRSELTYLLTYFLLSQSTPRLHHASSVQPPMASSSSASHFQDCRRCDDDWQYETVCAVLCPSCLARQQPITERVQTEAENLSFQTMANTLMRRYDVSVILVPFVQVFWLSNLLIYLSYESAATRN